MTVALTSQITLGTTTCSQFASGSANLTTIEYSLKKNLIQQTNPRVFSYWVRLTATAGSNTFVINQSITTGNFSPLFVLTSGSNVFDANCGNGLKPNITQSGNNVNVQWNAPSAGTYFISIKYASSSVVGATPPTPTTVHYDFSTLGVPNSTSGLDLMKKATGNAALTPTTPGTDTRNSIYAVVAKMIGLVLFGV